MCFQIDLRAETPVVPLRLRNLEAVTGEEDEGPSEGLVKPWGRFTEVRFNLFRSLHLAMHWYKSIRIGKVRVSSPDSNWKNLFSFTQFEVTAILLPPPNL